MKCEFCNREVSEHEEKNCGKLLPSLEAVLYTLRRRGWANATEKNVTQVLNSIVDELENKDEKLKQILNIVR